MSTSFGEFQADDKEYYFTTSQDSGKTYLCYQDDTQVILALSREEAKKMLELLEMAIKYAGED
jgi:hypothetical protein